MQSTVDWLTRWESGVGEMGRVSPVSYWNKRAEDYDDFIQTSRFSYGKRIVALLQELGVLGLGDDVLEIAGGVGALTLPLCRAASRVVSLEPASAMAERLRANARARDIANLELLEITGQEYMQSEPERDYDLGVMCHATWQFPDLLELVEFFDRSCRSWACLADTALATAASPYSELLESLGVAHAGLDRVHILYNALHALGRRANISFFDYVMRRSTASATAMMLNVTGKYREPTDKDRLRIAEYVAANSTDGVYEEPACMAVMWWKTKGGAA